MNYPSKLLEISYFRELEHLVDHLEDLTIHIVHKVLQLWESTKTLGTEPTLIPS